MYGSNADILVFESIFSCYKPPQPNKDGSVSQGVSEVSSLKLVGLR